MESVAREGWRMWEALACMVACRKENSQGGRLDNVRDLQDLHLGCRCHDGRQLLLGGENVARPLKIL
jgi:hypothetical protein